MKTTFLAIVSSIVIISTSCSKESYACACKDPTGSEHIETGTYIGNDGDDYLIYVESQLVEKHSYESCSCRYD